MKFVKEKRPYSPTSPRFLGKIYTQAGGAGKWILIGLYQAGDIIDGKVTFTQGKNGGIGTLQIGDYKDDKIPCLEREFRSDWEKIVRRILELLGIDEEDKFFKAIIKRQPQLPPPPPKKPRPTREQLMTDPRYNNERIWAELDEYYACEGYE